MVDPFVPIIVVFVNNINRGTVWYLKVVLKIQIYYLTVRSIINNVLSKQVKLFIILSYFFIYFDSNFYYYYFEQLLQIYKQFSSIEVMNSIIKITKNSHVDFKINFCTFRVISIFVTIIDKLSLLIKKVIIYIEVSKIINLDY